MPAGAVKLYMRTPAGLGLGLHVWLSSQAQESDGKIRSVEVILPPDCDRIVGYRVEALPKTPAGDQLLWADPGDLCADDGSTLNQEALLDTIKRVNDLCAEEMRRGPLGENWP
jgi:hypothetical protein